MALLSEWPDPTAVEPIPAAYLDYTRITIEPRARAIRVEIAVYRSAEDAAAGRDPVTTYALPPLASDDYDRFLADNAELVTRVRAVIEAHARAQPELAGAEPAP
jgi:hypothetical protein